MHIFLFFSFLFFLLLSFLFLSFFFFFVCVCGGGGGRGACILSEYVFFSLEIFSNGNQRRCRSNTVCVQYKTKQNKLKKKKKKKEDIYMVPNLTGFLFIFFSSEKYFLSLGIT